MTEEEWLRCGDSLRMLGFLRGGDRNSLPERRSRLIGIACCRRLWQLIVDPRSRKAIEVTERYADGLATVDELEAAYELAFDVEAYYAEHPKRRRSGKWEALGRAANAVAGCCHVDEHAEGIAHEAQTAATAAGITGEAVAQADLVRDIFGNPFQPVLVNTAWLTWDGGTVPAIASGIYDESAFDRLPILADALEDAGCDDARLLEHCRGAGPHVRGCWIVDLLLGKP